MEVEEEEEAAQRKNLPMSIDSHLDGLQAAALRVSVKEEKF